MFYINFVELQSLMLHTKFQNHWPSGYGEEDFYAPNFEEVEGAYWFGSVRPVQSSGVQCSQSVMRE